MEKIIIISHDAGNHAQLISLTRALFPECRIEMDVPIPPRSDLGFPPEYLESEDA